MNSDERALADSVKERLFRLIEQMSEDQQLSLLDKLEKSGFKRKHPRKPCIITVHYAIQDRVYKNYIQDISKGGVFIETSETFFIGQKVTMTFSMDNFSKPFMLGGRIVRSIPGGIGVEFDSMTPDQEADLQKLIDSMGDVWRL